MDRGKPHCSNREVVHANKRLFSPNYDEDGHPGLAWHEWPFDANAMCFFGMCGHSSYNAWVKATDAYINNTLLTHYNKVLARAKSMYGGAAFPIELQDKFNKVQGAIQGWSDAGYEANMTLGDDFRHPSAPWWWGEIRQIIAYYDEAACKYDLLDDIAANDLKQPSLATGAPIRKLEEIEGGYLGGHGGPAGGAAKGGRSQIGMAVGIMAIGAAGYFGFKVLTE